MILLDINLPKVNGLEVLKQIKEDSGLKWIPTVILTVSSRDEDIVRGYKYGCNSFIQKPLEFEKFVEAVKQIGLYWGLLNVDSLNTDDRRWEDASPSLKLRRTGMGADKRKMDTEYIYKDLTYKIIGCLYEVHKELGAVHKEIIYHKSWY